MIQNPSLRWRRITRENNHARNKHFQLPLIPRANKILSYIVLTANQRCGQNLAAASTNVRKFVSGPILAGLRKRECMRAAKIGPDLRLIACRNTQNAAPKYQTLLKITHKKT